VFLILVFTILGFLIGLAYIIKKRNISVSKVLAAAFVGLAAAGVFNAVKDAYKAQNKKRHY
jgi:hypothetical protein